MEISSPELFLESTSQPSKAQKRQQRKEAKHNPSVLTPRNKKQADLISALKKFPVVFAIGAAGSGKTYVSARYALQELAAEKIKRIVITRPTVSATRHKKGFLPGTDAQKMAPWLVPIMDAFRDGSQPSAMEKYQNDKKIEVLSFEHMRGRTIKDGVFLLDEGQNCTFGDLEMFITRIGENAQIIICGDPDQTDLGEESGLAELMTMALDQGLNAGVVIFDENDVVRSETASEWVKAFKKHKQSNGIRFLQNAA